MDESIAHSKPSSPNDEIVFRALSDSSRQRILQLLLKEELNVSELVEVMRQPQSTISRQLRVLKDADLIRDRRDGTATWYSATPSASVKTATRSNGRASRKNAEAKSIQGFMLHWFEDSSLPANIQERLQHVLNHRTADDGGFFNRLGRKWDELRSSAFGDAFALEAMLALLPQQWTVADIGTGTGYLLPALARHFAKVMAVEPAETMLSCAKQRVKEAQLRNVRFFQGELASLPMKSKTCDLALAMLVIHHVPNPAKALAEMYRVVRPGGRVLIVEQQSHENQAFYERMQDQWWGFEARELASMLTAAGFRHVRYQSLMTTKSASRSDEAPPLFVLQGERPSEQQTKKLPRTHAKRPAANPKRARLQNTKLTQRKRRTSR